jgi:3'-phosphoadenosine 5'-phosphosulfate sulfotransferase (PAPS reductase)/FAD synthetase
MLEVNGKLKGHGLPVGETEAVDVICSVSGGKDSTALALWLTEQGIPHRRVFFETGWEHKSTYEHLDRLADFLGPIEHLSMPIPKIPEEVLPEVLEIERLVGRSPSQMVRTIVSRSIFPTPKIRFCTQLLKVFPLLALAEQAINDGASTVLNVVGVRAEESNERANASPFEWMDGAGDVLVWRPMLAWTEAQVRDYLHRHNAPWAPLYYRGMHRLGCWPCIYADRATLQHLTEDADRVKAIGLLEGLVTRLARTRDPDAHDRTFFRGRTEDEEGNTPADIAALIGWATAERTRGRLTPRQIALFQAPRPTGCFRFGLCEVKP